MTNSMKFQIGKNGITEEVIMTLNRAFKTHKQIRIATLKSSGRDKNKIIAMADQIKRRLGYNTLYKIVGFTIIVNRRGMIVKK